MGESLESREIKGKESGPKGFEGITYFDKYDKVRKEQVEVDGAIYEYYPDSAYMRILKKGERGRILSWEYNLRSGFGFAPNGSMRNEDRSVVAQGMMTLRERNINLDHPLGYPEVYDVVARCEENPVWSDELERGKRYLVVNNENEPHFFAFGSLTREMFGRDEDVIRLYAQPDEILGPCGNIELYKHNMEPSRPLGESDMFVCATAFVRSLATDDVWRFYEARSDDMQVVAKLAKPEMDPWTGTELTREKVCMLATFEGLQYERWGKDEVRSGRYEHVNRENYHKALRTIIGRFGTEAFAQVAEEEMHNHMQTLHTELHLPGSPYKPHSDISPLGEGLMILADQVIQGAHPLPADMSESGHWVNAKSLFGDADFWNFVRTEQPQIFDRLTTAIMGWPKDWEQGTYARAKIDPVAVIKQYYPDAFAEVTKGRPNFDSDTAEGIQIIKEMGQDF